MKHSLMGQRGGQDGAAGVLDLPGSTFGGAPRAAVSVSWLHGRSARLLCGGLGAVPRLRVLGLAVCLFFCGYPPWCGFKGHFNKQQQEGVAPDFTTAIVATWEKDSILNPPNGGVYGLRTRIGEPVLGWGFRHSN